MLFTFIKRRLNHGEKGVSGCNEKMEKILHLKRILNSIKNILSCIFRINLPASRIQVLS